MISSQQQDSPAQNYDRVAVTLHWLVAMLIIVVGAVGLLFGWFPRPSRPFWINFHGSAGLVMALFILARVVWRVTHPAPPLPASLSAVVVMGSKALHLLMYVLMLVLSGLGLVAFIWHGRVFNYGLFSLDFAVKSDRAIYHLAQEVHGWTGYALTALFVLHVLAAVWHQFIVKDNLLSRMWFGART